MESYKLRPWWQNLTEVQQRSVISKLLDQLEVSNKQLRMKAARCILYLAQGCWAGVQSDKEQQEWTRINVMLLYEAGVFPAFVELLNMEIAYVYFYIKKKKLVLQYFLIYLSTYRNSSRAAPAMRKISVSLDDSVDLRVILSVLYIITEVMREEMKDLEHSIYKDNVESFKEDLIHPYGEELLIVKLLGMVTYHCSGSAPHFPMKKVLLLLWKLILVSLGGIDTLRELKKQYREEAGLDTQQEDTLEVAKTMRASSPPVSAADLIETQNQKKSNRSYRRVRHCFIFIFYFILFEISQTFLFHRLSFQCLMKQSSLDEPGLGMEYEGGELGNNTGNNESEGEMNVLMNQTGWNQNYCEEQNNQLQIRPSTPQLSKGKGNYFTSYDKH